MFESMYLWDNFWQHFFCKDGLHRMKYVNIQCILMCLYVYIYIIYLNGMKSRCGFCWRLLMGVILSETLTSWYFMFWRHVRRKKLFPGWVVSLGVEFSIKCLPNTTKGRWLPERSRESSRTFPLVVSDVLNKLCFHFWSPLCGLFSSQQPIYCTSVRPWRIISQAWMNETLCSWFMTKTICV